MPKADETIYNPQYLRQRREAHETACRFAASHFCNPVFPHHQHPCRLRRCRRLQVCDGPLLSSTHLEERLFAFALAGYSSNMPTTLPLCMIGADAAVLKLFEAVKADDAANRRELCDLRWPELAAVIRRSWWYQRHEKAILKARAQLDCNIRATMVRHP